MEQLELVKPQEQEAGEAFVMPASFAQRRLWLVERMHPGTAVFNVPGIFHLEGPLHISAFEKALKAMIHRHEILRTTFCEEEGEAMQVIAEEIPTPLSVSDLRKYHPRTREAEARRLILDEQRKPFDLERGPLLRARLIRIMNNVHWLVLTKHHIITDAQAENLFLEELSALYNTFAAGEVSSLPDFEIQYADYAHWQREEAENELAAEQRFWKRELADTSFTVDLPFDHLRAPGTKFEGAMEHFEIPVSTADAIRKLSASCHTTPFTVYLTTLAALLHRYSDQEHFTIGTPVSGRSRPETENLLGFFVNMLVLRIDVFRRDSFKELLQRLRQTVLGALDHQEFPFEKLVEELQPARRANQNPLFNVALAYSKSSRVAPDFSGLNVTTVSPQTGISQFDLTFSFVEEKNRVAGSLEYNTGLFEKATVRQMSGLFLRLLEEGLAADSKPLRSLPLMDSAERVKVVSDWNNTATNYPRERTVADLFIEQARLKPEAPAARFGSEEITYGELGRRSDQIASALRATGAQPGTFAGICVERSTAMLAGLLGILKAGCAYVPLDPAYPQRRLEFMIKDAEIDLVLTQRRLSASLSHTAKLLLIDDIFEHAAATGSFEEFTSEFPAYLMFTSGSTGQPKGAIIPNRAISRLVRNTNYLELTPEDVVAQAATISFDAATFEIWGALLNGARLEGIPAETLIDPERLAAAIRDKGITTMFLTTAVFNQIASRLPGAFSPLKTLLFGGEQCDPAAVRKVFRAGAPGRLLHVYGPTETTTFATWHRVSPKDTESFTIPIGKPVANTSVYILDETMQPAPPGMPGEICVGGDGVAEGYWNRPELTRNKFVPDPFSGGQGAQLYRSGDIGRHRADGSIEFLSRKDSQVKVRGFRIEPGEVETALSRHPAVVERHVCLKENGNGKLLVAYVAGKNGKSLSPSSLRQFLSKRLPPHTIPSAFVILDSLPLTDNGKVNRASLPQPDERAFAAGGDYVAPRTGTERALVEIWQEILKVEPIGVTTDFFESGGHSLLAAHLFAEIEKRFDVRLPLATVFSAPTIKQLADKLHEQMDEEERPGSPEALVELRRGEGNVPPFFCIHGGEGGLIFYKDLIKHLAGGIPLFGLEAPWLSGSREPFGSIADAARFYRKQIQKRQPKGPYRLGGFSFGGVVAFEMARQLSRDGEDVSLLALFDTQNPAAPMRRYTRKERFDRMLKMSGRSGTGLMKILWRRGWGKAHANFLKYSEIIHKQLAKLKESNGHAPPKLRFLEARDANIALFYTYQPSPYIGRLTLFKAETPHEGYEDLPALGWESLALGGIDLLTVPGAHETILREPNVEILAEKLNRLLKEPPVPKRCPRITNSISAAN